MAINPEMSLTQAVRCLEGCTCSSSDDWKALEALASRSQSQLDRMTLLQTLVENLGALVTESGIHAEQSRRLAQALDRISDLEGRYDDLEGRFDDLAAEVEERVTAAIDDADLAQLVQDAIVDADLEDTVQDAIDSTLARASFRLVI